MNLFNQNNMIFWEKVDEAAQYVVHLSIQAKITENHTGGGYFGSRSIKTIPPFLCGKHSTEALDDIAEQDINVFTVPREKTYHTFTDLVYIGGQDGNGNFIKSGLSFYATVIAEDREGNEIDKASVLVDIRR